MIIYNILFYIKCIDSLSQIYHEDEITSGQKKTISDMVKIWLFYNSSAQLFWTGMTFESASKDNKKVKEHQHSNLSSAKYMLSKDKQMHDTLFCELSKVEKICQIVKFMQWNFTTPTENQCLKHEQEYVRFYDTHMGDTMEAYKAAGIKLTGNARNLSLDLATFFEQEHKTVFEVKIKKQLLCKFVGSNNFLHYKLNDNQAFFISNKDFHDVIYDIIMCISQVKPEKDNIDHIESLKKMLLSKKGAINIYSKGFEKTLFCSIHDDTTTTNSVQAP